MLDHYLVEASSFAHQIDFLFALILFLVGFWFLLTEAVFFGFIFKFRKRDGVRAQYITGEEKRHKRWITIPHLLVLVCDIFIIYYAVLTWSHVKQDLPPADKTIRVIGQQWAFTFVQPGPDGQLDTADDITTVNDLHVQVNTVYHFKLESTDVLHDFSVPVFRLKQDAIPGRVVTGWFKPTRTGTFDVQCAEICGIGHGLMAARIHIESAAEHTAWMNSQTPLSVAANNGPAGS